MVDDQNFVWIRAYDMASNKMYQKQVPVWSAKAGFYQFQDEKWSDLPVDRPSERVGRGDG